MNMDIIKDSLEELDYVAGGLRSLGHLIQISAQSHDQIDLDGLGKLLMVVSTSVAQHYDNIHLGLYDKLPK
ncbi:hypothetical protein [Ursidibacter arcticus]